MNKNKCDIFLKHGIKIRTNPTYESTHVHKHTHTHTHTQRVDDWGNTYGIIQVPSHKS